MKRVMAWIFSLCLLLGLSVPAGAEGPVPRSGSVMELYSAEGCYTDLVGNMESYSYHVPQLSADTEAAKEINREIEERFGGVVEEQFLNMSEGYSLWCWNSEWHAYWHGSQLFLLLSANLEGGFTDLAAYGYDFEKDCRVSNEMILEELNISEEEYLSNLREKVQLIFEGMYSSLSGLDRERVGYDELLKKTLDWLDLEQPMFIDGTGQIVTIVKIASVAGAEWYYHQATPFAYG